MLRLHGFSQSGNTFKVAHFLNTLGLPWQPVFVDFMRGATRNADWREAVNAMGEAPVLEQDGRRTTQSGAILTRLARQHAPPYLGRDDDERDEVLRWLLFDNHKFTSYFASYRFNKAFGAAMPDAAVMAWLKGRIESAFGITDRHLRGRHWLVGDTPTIADYSLSGYLFYPVEESGIALEPQFPALAAWVARLRALPGFADPYALLPGDRIAPRW